MDIKKLLHLVNDKIDGINSERTITEWDEGYLSGRVDALDWVWDILFEELEKEENNNDARQNNN